MLEPEQQAADNQLTVVLNWFEELKRCAERLPPTEFSTTLE
jgi:hypothetical protein